MFSIVDFKSIHSLKAHNQCMHVERERKYACTVEGCGMAFYTAGTLKNHVLKVTTVHGA